jgi:ribonuclease R
LQLVIEALRGLCRDGQLVRLKKNHYALPDREHLVKGRVHAHPNGYGFLIPENRDLEDLYLNRREMRRVMHGDQVMARVDRKVRGGAETHIVQVIERGQKRLIGTYDELNDKPIVVPMDARIGPIALAKGPVKAEKGKVIAVEVSRYGTALSPTRSSNRQCHG